MGPENAAIIATKWKWPGTYLFHSHSLQEERGNMGEIMVEPSKGLYHAESMIRWQNEQTKKLQKSEMTTTEHIRGAHNAHTTAAPAAGHHCTGPQVAIAKGSWAHKFDSAGKHDYYCALHPWMEGSVTVG